MSRAAVQVREDNREEFERELEARIVLAKFEIWDKANPDAWPLIVDEAMREVENKRRFGVRWIMENLRKVERTDRCGEPFHWPNEYAPIIARRLVREHPECKPFISLRKSRFDALMNGAKDAGH